MNNITTTTLNGETLFTVSDDDISPKMLDFINQKDRLTINTAPLRYAHDKVIEPGDVFDFSVEEKGIAVPALSSPFIHYLVNRQLTKDNKGKTIPLTVMDEVTTAVMRVFSKQSSTETISQIQELATRAIEFFESQHVTYEDLWLTNRFHHPMKVSNSTVWLLSLSNQPNITPAEKRSLVIALARLRSHHTDNWDTIGVYNPRLQGYYLFNATSLYDTITLL